MKQASKDGKLESVNQFCKSVESHKVGEKDTRHLSRAMKRREMVSKEWQKEKKRKKVLKLPRCTRRVGRTNQLENNYYYCLSLNESELLEAFKEKPNNDKLTRSSVKNQKAKSKVWQKRASAKKSRGFRRGMRNNRKARRNFFRKWMMVNKEAKDKNKEEKKETQEVLDNSLLAPQRCS